MWEILPFIVGRIYSVDIIILAIAEPPEILLDNVPHVRLISSPMAIFWKLKILIPHTLKHLKASGIRFILGKLLGAMVIFENYGLLHDPWLQ